jgi:hypothetical protein
MTIKATLAQPGGSLLLTYAGIQVALWTLVPGLTHINPPLDVVELYAWGNNLQWGYAKHPPLPSLLIEGVYWLTGSASWSAYLLGQVSIALTFWAVWLLGLRLTTPFWAALGAMFLGGLTYFQFPTPEFNHNVLQMPLWAWAFFLLHRCWREDGFGSWIGLALILAAGFYTKYSVALVPAVALVFFLIDPLGRERLKGWKPWAAGALALALILPHLIWLVQHDFAPLTYARERGGEVAGLGQRFLNPLDFALNELLDHLPLLLALILLLFWPFRRKRSEAEAALQRAEVSDRRFLLFFGLGPLALILALSLAMGFDPKSAWGAPLFCLSGLLAISLTRPRPRAAGVRAAVVWLFAVTFLTVTAFGLHHLFGSDLRGKATKGVFPGPELAERLLESLPGAPEIVSGPYWEAGNLSLNLPGRPAVLLEGDLGLSPWITPERLREARVLLVWPEGRRNRWMPPLLAERAPLTEGQVSQPYPSAPSLPPLVLNYAFYGPEEAAAPASGESSNSN